MNTMKIHGLCFLATVVILTIVTATADQSTSASVDKDIRAYFIQKISHATADTVIIPPTPVSSDSREQSLNSIATLNAFQQAIENATPEGRIIQLEPGVYDFCAVVILEPEGVPPENYSVGLDGMAHYFNPYRMSYRPPFEEFGFGVSILGKQHLTIRGAPAADGEPVSIIRGCTDPRCMNVPFANFNIGFSIGGDFETPSRFVTIENIAFENFTLGLLADSHEPRPLWGITDPRFGDGSEDLLIRNNTFTDVHENFFGRKLTRLIIQGNRFISSDRPGFCIALLGLPHEYHPADVLIENNAIQDCFYGIILHGRSSVVNLCNNKLVGNDYGIVIASGTYGYHPVISANYGIIKRNSIEGGFAGITILGHSGWEVRNNRIQNTEIGAWVDWGPFNFPDEEIFQPNGAENNVITHNSFQSTNVGVLIGARSRNNTFSGNKFEDSTHIDYFLSGPDTLFGGLFTFGPASGNTIFGDSLKNGKLLDMSGCYTGPNGCLQIDEDHDGFFSEDSVDNANNDSDLLLGFSLNDEDLEEIPNYISGMQVMYRSSAPSWFELKDSDSDGLSDVLEIKLGGTGLCFNPYSKDSDGDGIPDADEFRTKKFESCRDDQETSGK